MSHVCGATCRTTPISRSALEMNPIPGHLFEGNPVGEDTKRRGNDTLVHLLETPAGSTHSSTRGLRPTERLERQAEFHYSDKMRPDSPGESGMQTRDPCLPLRGILGPGVNFLIEIYLFYLSIINQTISPVTNQMN